MHLGPHAKNYCRSDPVPRPEERGFLFIAGPIPGHNRGVLGIKGLPLRGRRHLPFHRQVGKKTFHIPDAKVPGMGLAAKKTDKAHYPLAAGLLGAVGIMMIAQHLAYLLHQLEFRIGVKSRFIFHVTPFNAGC